MLYLLSRESPEQMKSIAFWAAEILEVLLDGPFYIGVSLRGSAKK